MSAVRAGVSKMTFYACSDNIDNLQKREHMQTLVPLHIFGVFSSKNL